MSTPAQHTPQEQTLGLLASIAGTLRAILAELSRGGDWQGNAAHATVKQGATTVLVEVNNEPTEILQDNPWRREFLIYNGTGQSLTVFYGFGQSTAEYTTVVAASQTLVDTFYTGPVWAMAAAPGTVNVTSV